MPTSRTRVPLDSSAPHTCGHACCSIYRSSVTLLILSFSREAKRMYTLIHVCRVREWQLPGPGPLASVASVVLSGNFLPLPSSTGIFHVRLRRLRGQFLPVLLMSPFSVLSPCLPWSPELHRGERDGGRREERRKGGGESKRALHLSTRPQLSCMWLQSSPTKRMVLASKGPLRICIGISAVVKSGFGFIGFLFFIHQ